MAEKDTKITDWKSYLEQTSTLGTQNDPAGPVDVNGTTSYAGIGNAFRDIKRVVKLEFQNLGWDAANTYENTGSVISWELIDFADADTLRPKYKLQINNVNLVDDPATKNRWVTRGTKVFVTQETSTPLNGKYYWSGTVDAVGGTANTTLICSNVRQHFIQTELRDVTSDDKTYLNTPPDVTTTEAANVATNLRPADYAAMARGGFPEHCAGTTSFWQTTTAKLNTATLYVSSYRERIIPHDPDSQSYSSESFAHADLSDPAKNGLLNQISPYPSKTLQGCFFHKGPHYRVVVPLQSRQPDNKYSVFCTPLENYTNWGVELVYFNLATLVNRIEYATDDEGTKNCYTIVKIDKYVDRFVVEFLHRVPLDSESAQIPANHKAAILWEWLLVRDFR